MIVVVTHKEFNENLNRYETLVSHGIDVDTFKNIVLPQVSLKEIGAKYNEELGEYVLE